MEEKNIKTNRFLLIGLILLICISISAVSAVNDTNNGGYTVDIPNESIQVYSESTDNSVQTYNDSQINYNVQTSEISNSNEVSNSISSYNSKTNSFEDISNFKNSGDSISIYSNDDVSGDSISTYENDGNNIYVSINGKDSNAGDIDSPLATISHAVELANASTNSNIILGEGTFNAHDLSLVPGNFTLSGQGINKTIIDIAEAGRFMTIVENTTLIVKDLLIINGKADQTAVFYNNLGNLTLINTVIANSTATSTSAGAISTSGPLYLINSTIANCTAAWWGGAISSNQPGSIYIYNSTIDNCKSQGWNGGSICSYTTLIAENSNFTNSYGGGSFGGGAIFIFGYGSSSVVAGINNCNFENASFPSGSGGAIYCTVGNLTVTNSNFTNCTARAGSIIYSTVPTTLTNNSFKNSIGSEILSISKGNENITNNTYSNCTIGYKISASKDTAYVNDSVTVNITASNPSSYDADLASKTTYDIYVDGKYYDKTSLAYYTLTASEVSKLNTYVIPSVSGIVTNNMTLYYIANTPIGTIYLSTMGNDSNNGSKDSPVATLEQAMVLAKSTIGNGTIFVLPGNYTAVNLANSGNLSIEGSGANSSIIDASFLGNIFTNNGNLTLMGIGLVNGNSTAKGGAINNAGNLTLINVSIMNSNSTEGGAIYNTGNLLIVNSSLVNNSASSNGGALSSTKYMEIVNSLLVNNSAFSNGGAIYTNANMNITNSILNNNKASTNTGGAISISAHLDAINCTFNNNSAPNSNGGAIYGNYLNIINSTVTNNKAQKGGALMNSYPSVYNNTLFENNTASDVGGDIYSADNVVVIDSTFVGSYAPSAGSIYVSSSYSTNLTNNSFVNVSAGDETLVLGKTNSFESNSFKNCTIAYVLKSNSTVISSGDEVSFTIGLTNPNYYPADLFDQTNFTVVNNGKESYIGHTDSFVLTPTVDSFVYVIPGLNKNSNNITIYVVNYNVYIGTIYVSNNGNNNNNGSKDSPVATLDKAIVLASISTISNGSIFLLPGTYTGNNLDATNLTIIGSGANQTIIDALNKGNIFTTTGGNLTIMNITLINGNSSVDGGLIKSNGNLTLENIVVNNSMTSSSYGGVIYTTGSLNILNSTFTNCKSNTGGGAIYGGNTITVKDSKFENCFVPNNGGAIYSSKDLNLDNSSFINCTAGITTSSSSSYGYGAAVYVNKGNLTVKDSRFENCSSNYYGGAIYASSCSKVTISDSVFKNINASTETLYLCKDNSLKNNVYNNCSIGVNNVISSTYLNITFGESSIVNINSTLINPSYYDEGVLNNINYSVYVGGVLIRNLTGHYNYIITPLSVGNTTTYVVSTIGNKSSNNLTIVSNPIDTAINVTINNMTVANISYGENATVNFVVSPNLATGNVTVKIDGKNYTVAIVNGTGSTVIPNLIPGTYIIEVMYNGDTNYNPSSFNTTLNITSTNVTVSLIGNITDKPLTNQTIQFNVTDANGVSVNEGNVTVTIDNKTFTGSVVNGIATVNITTPITGNYTLNIAYNSDKIGYNNYSYDLINISIKITKDMISLSNMVTTTLSGDNFTATLLDGNGNPLAGREMSFTLINKLGENKTYWATTNTEGVAKLAIKLTYPSDYQIIVVYMENNTDLSPDSQVANITVVKGSINADIMLITPDMTTTKLSGENYTVTLQYLNGTVIPGQEINITLTNALGESKTYWATTNTEGVAKLPINLEYPTTYNLTSTFNGKDGINAVGPSTAQLIITNPVNGSSTSYGTLVNV